ncbi:MAG: hypothetical protein HKM06_09460 [Spirochaetales bacterium]|nr:hypothetical protein [Spirochaetales bacterium]
MKFKLLFTLFNVILGLSFLLLFFMPLPVLGWNSLVKFWLENWYIAGAFILVLGTLDAYFVKNWKLLRLLEHEDWQGLYDYLEKLRLKKPVLSPSRTKLYVNSCLILRKPTSINDLRQDYLQRQVQIPRSLALLLALPLILEGRSGEIKTFLAPYLKKASHGPEIGWLRWAYSFAQLIDHEWASAKENLFLIVGDTRTPLLQLLSLYLLDHLRGRDDEVPKILDPLSNDLRRRMTDADWKKHIEGLKEQVVLVLFMNQLISDARHWLEGGSVKPSNIAQEV